MASPEEPKPSTPAGGLLGALWSGDKTQKLIMALIVIGSGGNLLTTHTAEQTATDEMNRAINEVHDLHSVFADAMARQKRLEDNLEELLKRTPK
jgi:hypothetical protein